MYSVFPFQEVEKNSRIIIYGAGIAGRNFLKQVRTLHYCEVLCLIDRNYDKVTCPDIEVKSIDDISEYQYDYIVISVLNLSTKMMIKEELLGRGIPQEKIVASPTPELEWEDNNSLIDVFRGLLYANNTPLLEYMYGGFQHDIISKVQRSINTAFLHQKTFGGFKNAHNGKSMVMIGAGPTVKDFQPIPDAVYVGLNRAFLLDKVTFDYLFSIDKAGIADYYEGFFNYRRGSCTKFIGDQNLGAGFQIPEGLLTGEDIRRYKTTAGYLPNRCTLDIASEPLGNYESVSLQAMQFMLYTNPARIYLVGIDCSTSSKGHFTGKIYDDASRNEDMKKNDEQSVRSWRELKAFADLYYPTVEIISVNPVGLKGIFKDLYQENLYQ